nr:MAG: hypothetical protein [Bacteriophage sp.]
MNLEPNASTTEISNTLAAAKENCVIKTINLEEFETSYEITKHGSSRKLYLTPVEDGLIDIVLFNEKGTTLATCTLFDKNDLNITAEALANLITLCF